MTVLAIDTSSRRHLVCVAASQSGDLVEAVHGPGDAVARVLPPALIHLLRVHPTAVVVALGPGSYTGVRAGIAAAVGVAVAASLPLHGVGTLEVVAQGLRSLDSRAGTALADAGRGAVYAAGVARSPTSIGVGSPRRVGADAVAELLEPLLATEPLPLHGLTVVDPAEVLARAVPIALERPPLPPDGIRAVHVP